MKKMIAVLLAALMMQTLCGCSLGKSDIEGFYEISDAAYKGMSVDLAESYIYVENSNGDLLSSMRIDQGGDDHTYFTGNLQEMSSTGSSIQYKFWIDDMIGDGFEESEYCILDYNAAKNTITFVCDPLECNFSFAETQKTETEIADDLIDSIGTVSTKSENIILEAESAVSALSATEKNALKNMDILLDARSTLDDLLTLKSSIETLFSCDCWLIHNGGGVLVFYEDGTGSAYLSGEKSYQTNHCEFTYSFIDNNTIEITYNEPRDSVQFDIVGGRLEQSDNSDVYATPKDY